MLTCGEVSNFYSLTQMCDVTSSSPEKVKNLTAELSRHELRKPQKLQCGTEREQERSSLDHAGV